MSKPHLQEAFPEYKLMTARECLEKLNWKYEYRQKRFEDIRCDCGTEVCFGGWIIAEYAWCPNCGKGMQKMTCVLPAGNSTVGCIDASKYDYSDKKIWVPENIWGLR